MNLRISILLFAMAFLLVSGILVRTTLFTTLERTVAIIPDKSPSSAPYLRVAPPDLRLESPSDSPSSATHHSPQRQVPL